MPTTQCPCTSGQTYETCCQPFHLKTQYPKTAEQLMRSRYSAFAKVLPDYLIQTHHISARKSVTKSGIVSWAKANTWLRLEIVNTQFGTETDVVGMVEFKAYFLSNGKHEIHHEKSNFRKEDGVWYYLDGFSG